MKSTATSKKFLIIDDDDSFCNMVKTVLAPLGYNIESVKSVTRALKWIEDNIPDFILLDIDLGDENGLTFLERYAKNKKLQDTPVVVVSGTGNFTILSKIIAYGAKDFLLKPISPNMILQKVRKYLKAEELLVKEYALKNAPVFEGKLICEIQKIADSGVIIHSHCKMKKGSKLSIESVYLNEFDIPKLKAKVIADSSLSLSQSGYKTLLGFIALSEKYIAKIRSIRFGIEP